MVKQIAMDAQLKGLQRKYNDIDNQTLPSGTNYTGAGSLLANDQQLKINAEKRLQFAWSEEAQQAKKEAEALQKEIEVWTDALKKAEEQEKEMENIIAQLRATGGTSPQNG